MAQQIIDIGSAADDGTGDTLRDAYDKANDNFGEVYVNTDDLVGGIGAISAVLGQAYREIERLSGSQEANTVTTLALFNLASAVGQVSKQVNGGRAEHTGGSLDAPAIRIGTVGIYSSATDTLSIAIDGTEVARFTASGLTVYGTVTEA